MTSLTDRSEAKVREKTFDPGVAEEKRSAWVRSFDVLRCYIVLQCASTVPPSVDAKSYRNQM